MGADQDSGIATLATQGSITFVGNVVGKGLGFAFVILATRLVTPSEYGIFTLSLSIVIFAQGCGSLNLHRGVDYFVPQLLRDGEYGRAKHTLLKVLVIGSATSIVAALIVILLRKPLSVFFDEPRLPIVLLLFVVFIPLRTVLRTLVAVFNSLKKLKYRVALTNVLNPLFRIVGAVVLVSSGAGLFGLVGGYLLGFVVAIGAGSVFLLYEAEWVRKPAPLANATSNRSLLSYAFPLLFAGVIYSLVGQIDYFIIGIFLQSSDVGHYRVGFLLAANLLIVLRALGPVFKPMIAEASETSLVRTRYRVATRWITMCTLPLAITLVLAPEVYLSVFFTEQYLAASAAVIALTVGYVLNASFGPEVMVLEGLGYTRLTLINTIVLVGVNGILDVALVPRYGILGAGIATGTAVTVTGALGVIEIYYLRSVQPFTPELLKVWAASVPPTLVGFGISLIVVEDGILAVTLPTIILLFYIIGLRVTGSFTQDDIEIAIQMDNKFGVPLGKVITGYENR
jgi:O-antigen/teichoic acid export membrane protein